MDNQRINKWLNKLKNNTQVSAAYKAIIFEMASYYLDKKKSFIQNDKKDGKSGILNEYADNDFSFEKQFNHLQSSYELHLKLLSTFLHLLHSHQY